MFPLPCRLELGWGEIAERRMNALRAIDSIDELSDLRQCFGKVTVLCEVDLLFLDSPNHTLGIAVLSRFADRRHTDLNARRLQGLDILGCCILNPLIAVVNDRRAVRERPLEGGQGQFLRQRTAELPAANVARK